MNTQLKKLFIRYDISERDQYEIGQIFVLLPDKKKTNLLNNFEFLAFKVKKIHDEMALEQKILLDKMIPDINDIVKQKYKTKQK